MISLGQSGKVWDKIRKVRDNVGKSGMISPAKSGISPGKSGIMWERSG